MAGSVSAQRKYRYGLDADQYAELLRKQDGKCAGCGNGEVVLGRGGEVRSLSVDHCHTTGMIRGLLCDSCNNILGRADDSPARLRRLASYLEVASTGHKVKSLYLADKRKWVTKPTAVVDPDDMLNELLGEPSCQAS